MLAGNYSWIESTGIRFHFPIPICLRNNDLTELATMIAIL